MKKIAIAALVVAGLAGASATNAAAAAGPCATQQALFEKYGIGLGMHQEEVEAAYSAVCRTTG
jgi:hypothetical protein